ncbi:hypothetical protein FN846DRAFT_754071, partial [Sphaerosporella brunnea]
DPETTGFIGLIEPGPHNINSALNEPDAKEWKEAIESELAAHNRHGTFEPLTNGRLPDGAEAITSRLILQRKLNGEGEIEKYKARLV